MRNRDCKLLQTSDEATGASYPTRVGFLCAVGLASALFVGCSELKPMREGVDLELTTDTLKASVRDAQRMVTELRVDLEAGRKDLAEAQVARAQLEGRVREAERRVVEARQVIELQREELGAARIERTQLSRSSLQIQGRMRELQKVLSKTGKSNPAHYGQEAGQKAMKVPAQRNQPSEFSETSQLLAIPIAVMPVPANPDPSGVEESMASTQHVSVKLGDTLWSIAQKYHVHLEQLRSLNRLTDNRIVIGQALRLPDDQYR